MMKKNRAISSFLGFLLLASLISCATTTTKSAGESAAPEDGSKKKNVPWHVEVSKHDYVTFEDACRALLGFLKRDELKGAFPKDDYKTMVEELKSNQIMPANWQFSADCPITRRQMSLMICRALKIKGGIIPRIFGMTERYAYKECTYHNLISGGGETLYIDGLELVAIVHRMVHFSEHGSLDNLSRE